MAIKEITLCIGDKETYKVGGPYLHGSPAHGIVTRIKKERSTGGFIVYNDQGGHAYYAAHYVDPDSIK